ncbi:MAG TPA: preprotein translocase subunit SecA, partial [Candidatus Limnocylindria bacterium]|nr:preprotein translocase subunit SecA [Candidatus Limnocylindria bacterium]
MANILTRVFGSANDRMLRRLRTVVDQINALEETFRALPGEAFPEKTREFRAKLEAGETTLDDLLPEAFAAVREASRRTIGLRHYDVQLLGGMVLHRGMIAEMKTGEGKTLVATLPLYLNALTGRGAHLVTVNDYLARRDVQWMGPIYHFLGLTVGSIIHDASFRFDPTYLPNDYRFLHLRPVERREAYRCDITYGTNNEFGFDYLRDNMKESLDQYVQRDLHYAIVDEVDNILIDEARTPLIISGQAEQSSEKYYTVNRIIPRLVRDADYTIDEKHRSVMLTEDGVAKCERLLGVSNLYDPSQIDTLHHVTQALRAHVLFKRDVDYVVKEGEVIIVDEFTGRQMPGRRWSDGLHQAVEAKEGVRIESENVTLATITIQNYFRMYEKLAGMTGTADTEAVEFKKTYKLDVAVIPPNKPTARTDYPDVVYLSEREKFDAVVQEIRECHERGQPVLVGTTSVEKSERVSKLLKKAGVRHNVLNAINHEAEANIIAQAGRYGQVTIATNMAGRGTDILLGGNPEYLARADMENDWIREARKAGGGDARAEERFEDTLRALHERYEEEKQALRERFGAELARLETARAEALKALSDAEEKLRKASPLRPLFERYERVKEVEFDPSVRHGDAVPERYRQLQAELDAALDERAAGVSNAARAQLARLREQFLALQEVWDQLRTTERRPARGTGAPAPASFRASLAEVLLAGMPHERRVAVVREALAARGTLAEDEAPWLARFEAGQTGVVGAQPPVVEAVSERLTAELDGKTFGAAALAACRDDRELAAEGLDAWRFEYEKAARDLELLCLLHDTSDPERARWAADYRAAEERHAAAERDYEACRQPYDEGMRAAERRYDEQRAVYTRQVAEIREELQKAPQAYAARFREKLEYYQQLCREERERVVAAGGLHIIGTERHEARRIDNQLRGRAGRQGDPGSSRFYLSLEDDLLRIFGADRMQKLMERLGMKEGEPIEHRMLTRAVRNAQEKVEAHNFDVRKHLLEYDDVLNKQREVIYARRRELLANTDLKDEVLEMAERLAASVVETYADPDTPAEEWDWKTFDDAVFAQFNFHLQVPEAERASMTPQALEDRLVQRVREVYEERERNFGAPVLRYLERFFSLQTLDTLWREHLVAMEHLKEGIGLRGYGQKNPLQEYQKEGYALFEDLIGRMEADVVEKLMSVQVQAGATAAAVRPRVAAAGGGQARPAPAAAPAAPVPDAVADIERRHQQ